MQWLGIDLGNSGAIAIWDGDAAKPPTIHPFPVDGGGEFDACRFREIVAAADQNRFAVYENVFRPNSLVKKAGAVDAACRLLGIEVEGVAVVSWKKAVLGENSKDKQLSVNFAKRQWPEINLRRSARARTDWHDAAEAACLAYYAKEIYQWRSDSI